MDLNQLYADHQLLLIKTGQAPSSEARRRHEIGASLVAGRIGCIQRAVGAAGAPAWETMAGDRHGSFDSQLRHQPGCAS